MYNGMDASCGNTKSKNQITGIKSARKVSQLLTSKIKIIQIIKLTFEIYRY